MEACLLVSTFLDVKTGCQAKLLMTVGRVLLNYERLVSSSLGRVCSIRPEEWVTEHRHFISADRLFSFDLDLPVDCDDEYWPVDGGTEGFEQPLGKPSKLTMFILMINLFHLQTDVVRLLVSASSL